jgi:hypothetical protein
LSHARTATTATTIARTPLANPIARRGTAEDEDGESERDIG